MTSTLYRASMELGTEGRTLVGVVWRWNAPSLVSDDGGRTMYREEFAPESADVSISQGGPRPLFVSHDYRRDPIGSVAFHREEHHLGFAAPVSRTRAGDEALELVKDGAFGSVSGGFKPIDPPMMRAKAGQLVRRTAVNLRELSLAPTGFGQHPDAKVLAVRAEEAIAELKEALEEKDADEIVRSIQNLNSLLATAVLENNTDAASALSVAIDSTAVRLRTMLQADAKTPGRDELRRRLAALPA
jgi:HK97 family phage prohead protease